jgi:hypothetical protein
LEETEIENAKCSSCRHFRLNVFRVFEKQLGPEMQNAFRKGFPTSVPTKMQESQLIERIEKRTRRLEAPITKETADILDEVCGKVLARVRYAPVIVIGLDGVSYHAAHFQIGVGYRAGKVWSPAKGTIASDFVELTETLATLTQGAVADRSKIEATLTQQAQRLLDRLR